MTALYETPIQVGHTSSAGQVDSNTYETFEEVTPRNYHTSRGETREIKVEGNSKMAATNIKQAVLACLLLSTLAISIVGLIFIIQLKGKTSDMASKLATHVTVTKDVQKSEALPRDLLRKLLAQNSNLLAKVEALKREILDQQANIFETSKTSILIALQNISDSIKHGVIITIPADCAEYKELIALIGKAVESQCVATLYPFKSAFNYSPIRASCVFKGSTAWMVIQRRKDGSVDFYRNWANYTEGFGNPSGEYWIGLETLHKLTSARNYTLRIDLQNWEDEKRYAEYSVFHVGNKESDYTLKVSGYSGDAGDGMSYHNGKKFSTFDHDNSAGSCPNSYQGAWWYNLCYHANLNGKYRSDPSIKRSDGVAWQLWLGESYSLKFVEMKMRPA